MDNMDGFEEWASASTVSEVTWVTTRAALRALPLVASGLDENKSTSILVHSALRTILSIFVDLVFEDDETNNARRISSGKLTRATGVQVTRAGRMHNRARSEKEISAARGELAMGSLANGIASTGNSSTTDAVLIAFGRIENASRTRLSDQVFDGEVITDTKRLEALNTAATWAHNRKEGTTLGSDTVQWLPDSFDGFSPFWRDWHQGFLMGSPLDWTLQRSVALIKDEHWEKGPEHIAEQIEVLRRGSSAATSPTTPTVSQPVTPIEMTSVKSRVEANREALALSIAGVIEQLTLFREKVRGLNNIETIFREELLELTDYLTGKLEALLHDLPNAGEEVDDARASRIVLWLREFRPLVRKSAAEYASPGNVAEATVPTGIILGCTAIGSLVGPAGAVVGGIVGGLITNQVKPSKAVDELLQSGSDDMFAS